MQGPRLLSFSSFIRRGVLRFYYAIQFLSESVEGLEVEMNDFSDFYVEEEASGWEYGWGGWINNYSVRLCVVYVNSSFFFIGDDNRE